MSVCFPVLKNFVRATISELPYTASHCRESVNEQSGLFIVPIFSEKSSNLMLLLGTRRSCMIWGKPEGQPARQIHYSHVPNHRHNYPRLCLVPSSKSTPSHANSKSACETRHVSFLMSRRPPVRNYIHSTYIRALSVPRHLATDAQ